MNNPCFFASGFAGVVAAGAAGGLDCGIAITRIRSSLTPACFHHQALNARIETASAKLRISCRINNSSKSGLGEGHDIFVGKRLLLKLDKRELLSSGSETVKKAAHKRRIR